MKKEPECPMCSTPLNHKTSYMRGDKPHLTTGWGGPPYSMPQSNGPERSTVHNAVAAYAGAISGVDLRACSKGTIRVPCLTVAGFYE